MQLPPRLSFLAAFTIAAASFAIGQTPPATKTPAAKVGSTVITWEQLTPKPTKAGERRDVFDGPTATLENFESHITTLNPGESPHAPHRHPDEELIIVKTGTLDVTINGVTKRGGEGSIFFYGSNDLHGMKNVGTTPATYFVFRFATAATPKAEPK
jgi:quercetin dioxygenase-like cupin family protein